MELGIASVASITAIAYLLGMAVKATEAADKWIPIICGAARYMTSPITAITAMPIPTVMPASFRASPCRPAPTLCPTSVVAASAIP